MEEVLLVDAIIVVLSFMFVVSTAARTTFVFLLLNDLGHHRRRDGMLQRGYFGIAKVWR